MDIVKDLEETNLTGVKINISRQALDIINTYEGKFPFEQFKKWFIENKIQVSGNSVFEFICTQFNKEVKDNGNKK